MDKYTIEELEQMVKNQSRCYQDSDAFQAALEFIKPISEYKYKQYLYKEAIACGAIDE